MGTTTEARQQQNWTTVQAYVLALLCLVIGIPVGYLFHGPTAGPVNQPAPNAPQAAAQNVAFDPSQITPAQLAHMADKQAEPLLAELKTHPDDEQLLTKIGDLYLSAQQPQIAQQYYERSLAAQSANPAALTQLASAYYYEGDADEAIANLQRALAVDPGYANALFNLGLIKWRAKADPKGAIESWQKLLKSHPDHPKRAQVEQMIARAKQHMNMPASSKPDKPDM